MTLWLNDHWETVPRKKLMLYRNHGVFVSYPDQARALGISESEIAKGSIHALINEREKARSDLKFHRYTRDPQYVIAIERIADIKPGTTAGKQPDDDAPNLTNAPLERVDSVLGRVTGMPEHWSKADCDEYDRTGKLPPSASHIGEQPPAIVDVAPVSDADDMAERERQEVVIVTETGVALLSVLRIGQALRIIKERKLYRSMTVIRDRKPVKVDGYNTLEEYTRARFGFQKGYRGHVLNLAQVFVDCSLEEKATTRRLLTLTENSFRPMYRLDTEQRRTAWNEIEKRSPGEHITPGTIAKTVNRLYPNPKKPVTIDLPTEQMVDAWINKFLSKYPKPNWDAIAEIIEQRAGYWRNELVEV